MQTSYYHDRVQHHIRRKDVLQVSGEQLEKEAENSVWIGHDAERRRSQTRKGYEREWNGFAQRREMWVMQIEMVVRLELE